MKTYHTICRHCGEPILLFDVAVDEEGFGAVKTCVKCGAENSMRTQVVRHETVEIKDPPQIESLLRYSNWLFWLTYASIMGIPLLTLWAANAGAIPPLADLSSKSRAGDKLSMLIGMASIMWSGLPIAGVLFLLRRSLLRKATRLSSRRNTYVARLETKPPILLLRSFFEGALSRHSRVPNPYSEIGSLTEGEPIVKSIEKELSEFGRPVAIGMPSHEMPDRGDHEIVFIETSDADWHNVFLTVAKHSRFILLSPGWTTGVLHEMKTISAEGLWRRTVVYMPPILDGSRDTKIITKSWGRARNHCATIGMQLPEYDQQGMLYVPNSDFSVNHSYPLLTVSGEWALPAAIALALPELLGMLEGNYGTMADTIKKIETDLGVELY